MKKNNRSDDILRDMRKTNLRVDTLLIEIQHNIEKTNQEIEQRKKAKK